jgi:hypothetical protein
MYLFNYYLYTDVVFLSFLSIHVRVSVLGSYLVDPNVFKVADAFCRLLLLGCACALCVTSPLCAAVGGAVWRFSVFIFFFVFYNGCLYFMLLWYSCLVIKVKHFPLLDPVQKNRCLISYSWFFFVMCLVFWLHWQNFMSFCLFYDYLLVVKFRSLYVAPCRWPYTVQTPSGAA